MPLLFLVLSECYQWLILYLVRETTKKQSRIEKLSDKFAARAESQVYCAAILSKVYIEYLALQTFWTKAAIADSSLRSTLGKLGALYGLWSLDKHLVYFYQVGV